jgi:hypothetical protein
VKRIIRSNAVKTQSEVSNSDIGVSEVVTIYSGAVLTVPTKKLSTLVWEDNVNSVSLQTILNRQPSVVPCLVVLSSIAFLVISLIWAMNTKVEEVSLFFELAPSNGREKVLKTANYHTEIKIIPTKTNSTESRFKKQTMKVRFTHTYRVADMFFEE